MVVAPARRIGREWRFVVVDRTVVAGAGYRADGRRGAGGVTGGVAWDYADRIARQMDPPEAVYVLDVAEVDDRLGLLELNPFSGADLYDCDLDAVVAAVADVAG